MKKVFILIFSLFISALLTSNAQPGRKSNADVSELASSQLKVSTIDIYDTVVFDLSQNIITGSSVSFPVFIMSDDIINAVDFSLKFDTLKFSFDTIFDLTTYLMESFYYNTNDFKLRFTSSSLVSIPNNTNLISVRFNMLAGVQMCAADLNTIAVYLNGDACSFKVIECDSTVSVPEIADKQRLICYYPNPASDQLTIETGQDVTVQILSMDGKEVLTGKLTDKTEINIEGLREGVYFVRAFNDIYTSNGKLVVSR
jgi:hypothetical protein